MQCLFDLMLNYLIRMITELNIPTDSPIEFFRPNISTCDDDDAKKKNNEIAKLFLTNESKKMTMGEHQMILPNRRYNDGSAMNCGRPNKLWEDLFVRTFTAKLASTIDNDDNRINTKLFNSSTTDKTMSNNTLCGECYL
jgi:hypothetical protein